MEPILVGVTIYGERFECFPLTQYALQAIFIPWNKHEWLRENAVALERLVSCAVEYTNDFADWWNDLTMEEQISVDAYVQLLEQKGAQLPYPYSSGVNGSRHSHMRELRVQHQGEPYRVLYAFDPRRMAILLIGGCKGGDDRWYEKFVPLADNLYDEHLDILVREGEL